MNRNMMRQVQQLQARLEKAKAELETMTVEGTSGGGAVTVVMNGHQQVRAVRIAPEAVDPQDVETLQDMVLAAVNDASDKSQALAAKHLGPLTSGLGLPGM